MRNAIDGPDETDDIDFGQKPGGHPFLRQLGGAIGWIALLVGFVLAVACLTPPQMSAEADLFEAQVNGEAPK